MLTFTTSPKNILGKERQSLLERAIKINEPQNKFSWKATIIEKKMYKF